MLLSFFSFFYAYNFLGGYMHLYKTIKNFLLDQDYFIDLWKNYVHVYGFNKIEILQETKIVLTIQDFQLEITGHDFRVLKLTKQEILIQGNLKEMRIL